MINLKNIHKSYFTGSNSLHVLKGVDLEIAEGELVSIMGSSGSGKSTLLNIIGMLDNYDEGDFFLNGERIQNMSEKKAFVNPWYNSRNQCSREFFMLSEDDLIMRDGDFAIYGYTCSCIHTFKNVAISQRVAANRRLIENLKKGTNTEADWVGEHPSLYFEYERSKAIIDKYFPEEA